MATPLRCVWSVFASIKAIQTNL